MMMKLLHRRLASPRRLLILVCTTLAVLLTYYLLSTSPSHSPAVASVADAALQRNAAAAPAAATAAAAPQQSAASASASASVADVECLIEDTDRVACLSRGGRVYVPFDYLKRRYELSGGLSDDGRLRWYASYAKPHRPVLPYSPYGAFLHFADYSVERRDRVLRVSPRTGVPVSRQWDPKGHEYVIQVAQYGLSHFSKAVLEAADADVAAGDADSATLALGDSPTDWTVPDGAQLVEVAANATLPPPPPSPSPPPGPRLVTRSLLHFIVPSDLARGIRLTLSRGAGSPAASGDGGSGRTVLRLIDFLSVSGASVTVQVATNRRGTVRLHYGADFPEEYRAPEDRTDVYFGIGGGGGWRTISRDLSVDLEKAFADSEGSGGGDIEGADNDADSGAGDADVATADKPAGDEPPQRRGRGRGRRREKRGRGRQHGQGRRRRASGGGGGGGRVGLRRIQWVSLRGSGYLGRVEFATPAAARQAFYTAAGDWLVANQNASTGAWPIRARRVIGRRDQRQVLHPGWCSAMGQGQAMSLLVRLHKRRPDRADYLAAAVRGLGPFQRSAVDAAASAAACGVTARLFDRLIWYEEYPVTSGLFVLNGFVYSLFGLYDLRRRLTDLTASGESAAAVDGVSLRSHLDTANRLYTAGVDSLKAAIGLFDHGDGTYYDLRHVTTPGEEPRRARWDYHSVHVTQMMALVTLEPDQRLLSALDRWERYLHGYRVKHN